MFITLMEEWINRDMKNLRKYNEFINEGVDEVRNLDQLYPMEKWIESVWSRLEGKDDVHLSNIFNEIEDNFGEDIAQIIDGQYSADKLHYNQSGRTVATGGIDTGDFIENFEEIKNGVDSIISKNLVSENKTFEGKDEELADWQQRWDQLMMDMEEEAEPEGGEVADQYGSEMENLEREKEEIERKYSKSTNASNDNSLSEEDDNFLNSILNYKQIENLSKWVDQGRDENFIRTRLVFFGVPKDKEDEAIRIIFSENDYGNKNIVNDYGGGEFESIKRFEEFSKINERSNIEELLANPENMWIVYVGNEPIGGMEYLHDALHDVLLPRVADTEEEEYDMSDRIDDLLSEVGSDFDDVDQDELDDALSTMMNEMGKTPIYRIVKRNEVFEKPDINPAGMSFDDM
jgi:hypothetical protein